MIKVLLCDDQEMVRAGFRLIVDLEDDLEVVGEAADGKEAVAATARLHPDVVLMDVRMPVMDGIEATRRITSVTDPARVLVLTTFDLDDQVYAAMKAGASGFLLKDAPPEDLLHAIRSVHAGDAVIAPSSTRRLLERLANLPEPSGTHRFDELTEREREVLLLMARGKSNQEICAELYLAEPTVKTHVGRVLAKLGARDRVQAVVMAHEAGLVRPQA